MLPSSRVLPHPSRGWQEGEQQHGSGWHLPCVLIPGMGREAGCQPVSATVGPLSALHPPPAAGSLREGLAQGGQPGHEQGRGRSGGEQGGPWGLDRGLQKRIPKYISRPQKPHWKIRFELLAVRDGAGLRRAALSRASPDGASWCRLTKQTNSIARNELRLRAGGGVIKTGCHRCHVCWGKAEGCAPWLPMSPAHVPCSTACSRHGGCCQQLPPVPRCLGVSHGPRVPAGQSSLCPPEIVRFKAGCKSGQKFCSAYPRYLLCPYPPESRGVSTRLSPQHFWDHGQVLSIFPSPARLSRGLRVAET